jgi:hypothetical protein
MRTHCTDSVGHWKCDKELKRAAANPTSLKSAAICVFGVCFSRPLILCRNFVMNQEVTIMTYVSIVLRVSTNNP